MNISYIVPHFENIEGLKNLLNSIILIKNDEIIIVDDCSEESTKEKLASLQKLYKYKLYFTSENSGAGAARNIGIKMAKNEWLCFADSDDEFVQDYLKKINEYRNSTSEIVYFSPVSRKLSTNYSVRSNRHEYYAYLVQNYINDPSEKNKLIMKYKFVVPWSKLIKKDFVINNCLEFEEVSVSNDILFAAKIANKSSNIEVSNYPIYCVLEHENSMTADISYQKFMLRLTVYIGYYNYIKENMNEKMFKKINITGTSFLIQAIRSKYTYRQIYNVYKVLKKEHIVVFNLKYLINTLKRI